jgi:hypothetical protein
MAIAYSTVSQGTGTDVTLTISHTVTGTNPILLVCFWFAGGDWATGVTYNSVSMTQIDKIQRSDATGRWGYLYYLENPSAGTNNIVISVSTSTTIYGYGISYTGAGKIDNHGTNTANATTLYNTLTSVADNQRVASGGGDGFYDSNSAKTPAGSTTIGVTTAPTTDYLACCTVTIAPYVSISGINSKKNLLGVGL